MAKKPYKLCYPQLGRYDIPIGYFVRQGIGLEYIAPPPMTKRTIDLGAKYSPDFVCAPFKCMMGCYIEAMEQGANVIIGTGGTCRLGYYGELHEQILKDAGYDFKFMNITMSRYGGMLSIVKGIWREYAPDVPLPRIMASVPAVMRMIKVIDRVEDYLRKNIGFEDEPGAHETVYKEFLASLEEAVGLSEVNEVYKKAMRAFAAIPSHKPEHPLRVGVIGEYFTIMDPFSNHDVELKIAKMGAEVHRWMNLSNSVISCPDEDHAKKLVSYLHYDLHHFPSSIWVRSQLKTIRRYAKYDVGASSVATIALANHYAKESFDGLIHVKSFGCIPEIDAVPILHNISADYHVPILFLSYDTQTSDTGIETRLEAFYDMISMKKEQTT